MSAEHDYTAPAQLRDENLERGLDTSQSLRTPTASPTPRVALWVSIIAGIMLVIGMSYALAIEFSDDPAPPSSPVDGSVSAASAEDVLLAGMRS